MNNQIAIKNRLDNRPNPTKIIVRLQFQLGSDASVAVTPIIGIKYINPLDSKPMIKETLNKIEARKGLLCERENE